MSVQFTTRNSTTGVFSEDDMEVAQGWAPMLGDALGIGFDETFLGEESLESVKGRVLLAMAISPKDEGLPFHTVDTILGPATTSRREGYLQEKLDHLLSVIESGERQGHDLVIWR